MKDLEQRCFSESWTPERPTLLLHLHGFAGLGKSEAAVFFVNSHLDKFSLVWRIRVDDEVMYEDDYRVLAKALKIFLEKETIEQVVDKVHSKLSMRNLDKPWLLLLDGIEKRASFPERGGIVLSTSQTEKLWEEQKTIPIEPFDLAQTKEFFTSKEKITNLDGLELLHEKLQGWPILLSNAYTYIIDTEATITDYLRELESSEPLFTREETAKYPHSLAEAFTLTLNRLGKKSHEALQLLFLCAYLNPSEIQLSLFKEKEEVGFLKWKKEVIFALKNLSIICLQEETFNLHGLWQSFLRQKFAKEEKSKEQFRLSVKLVRQTGEKFAYNKPATWDKGKSCALHLETLQKMDNWDVLREEENALFFDVAGRWLQYVQGNINKALECFQIALDIRKRYLEEEHLDLSISYSNLGYSLKGLGRHTEALEFYLKALEICNKSLGEYHSYTATSYNNVGESLGELGRHEEALKFQQQALKIMVEIAKGDHCDIIRSYNAVGVSLEALGKPQEALKFHQKAFDMACRMFVEENPTKTGTYGNLALVLGALGRHQEALRLHQDAVDSYLKAFGKDHPTVAKSYNNMGGALSDLGRHQEALECYKKALDVWLVLFGEQHPDVAISYNNLGTSFGAMGKHQEALRVNQKALEINLGIFSEVHPNIGKSYSNVGFSLAELGQHSEAISFFQKALKIWGELFEEGSSGSAISYNNLGRSLGALGKHEEALNYKRKALDLKRKIWGDEHFDTAIGYNSVGISLEALEKYQEALDCFQKALEIRQKVLGSDHIDTARSYYNVGSSLGALGRDLEALEHNQKALAIRRKVCGCVFQSHRGDDSENIGGPFPTTCGG